MRMYNLYIPICGFSCALLLVALFFTKKRIKNKENELFSKMLITSFVDSILMLSIILLAYLAKEKVTLMIILNKLDYIQFLIWVWCMFLYVLYVTYKDNSRKYEHFKLIESITGILNLMAIGAIMVLKVTLYNENNIMYSYGIATNFVYSVCILYLLAVIIVLIANWKKIFNVKYIPFLVFLLLATLVVILFKLKPGLVIVSAVLAYVDLIMYNTIENPDMKMVEELNIARDQAEKANNAKTEFLSNMSHEIRTPLNAIVGFSHSLEKENLSPTAQEDVKYIISASDNLLDIVNGILDISKIEADKLEIVNTEYDIREVLDELVALSKARLGEKPIDFNYSFDESLPKYLYGDYSRLKQIILNLLTNAIKYTKEGHIDFKVDYVKFRNFARLIISVEDTGIGIKKENIDKLFDKFKRLDLEQNISIEGTGLGLAITKRLVQLMNGKIVVQSEYGKGSKFTVAIDQKISDGATIKDKEEIANNLITDFNNKKVLVVDDNKLNLKVAEKLLSEYNITSELANSGDEAIEFIKNNNKYDLILMDDMMPHKSGIDTLHELKTIDGFNMYVIALTANAISGMREKYLGEGFNDYLAKPINKDELTKVLNKFLKDGVK